jgi:hypothetical protein
VRIDQKKIAESAPVNNKIGADSGAEIGAENGRKIRRFWDSSEGDF